MQRGVMSGSVANEEPAGGYRIRSPHDAFLLFGPALSSLPRERVQVAFLGEDGAVIAVETVAEGTAAAADLPIARMLRDAVLRQATGLVVAHNHPSGNAMPSREDVVATRRLIQGAAAIDVTLVDHVVIGRGEARSFRLMGLL